MKKYALLSVILVIVLSLAACGSKGTAFQDDFSTTSSGWDKESGSTDTKVGYDNGEYQIAIMKSNWSQWANPGEYKIDGDAVVEVDAWKESGPETADYGVICNYQDVDNFMILAITNDGEAEIIKVKDGKDELLANEIGVVDLAAKYHLKAICLTDGNYSLNVNGKDVISYQDSDFAGKGGVGLYGGTFNEPNATFRFDNFFADVFQAAAK